MDSTSRTRLHIRCMLLFAETDLLTPRGLYYMRSAECPDPQIPTLPELLCAPGQHTPALHNACPNRFDIGEQRSDPRPLVHIRQPFPPGKPKGTDLFWDVFLFLFVRISSWPAKCRILQHYLPRCTYFTLASFGTSACHPNIPGITSRSWVTGQVSGHPTRPAQPDPPLARTGAGGLTGVGSAGTVPSTTVWVAGLVPVQVPDWTGSSPGPGLVPAPRVPLLDQSQDWPGLGKKQRSQKNV